MKALLSRHPHPGIPRLLGTLLMGAIMSAASAAPFQVPVAPLIQRPAEPGAIPLYDGTPPGAQAGALRETWAQAPTGREVRNVSLPVLVPVLPPVGKANGTAVIVAPGGGFRGLAIDNEGLEVARRLAAEGVSAFVLKYRVLPTIEDPAQFAAELTRLIASGEPVAVYPASVDDGRRAVQLVRQRAAAWGIRADRVGLLGFSAGAMVTLQASIDADPAVRPSFAGMIYGPVKEEKVPAGAPPAFIALAANDALFANGDYSLIGAWQKTGSAVEFHLYGAGNHGFGMRKHGTTSDLWFEQFLGWLRMRGLLASLEGAAGPSAGTAP
jgi:acetyl esterase/lipase